tara:strand:+ start:8367 stop:8933 length:567 start_codon:yes stop_codon:yes gene_type:complete
MKANKSKYLNKILTLSLLFFGYLYVTPYLSLFLFKGAIESNNSSKLNGFIDFYSFRNSLKSQLKPAFQNKLASKIENTPFSEIGIIIANPILNKTVDSIVENIASPKGFHLLLTSGKIYQSEGQKLNLKENIEAKKSNVFKLYYNGINSFVVSSQIMEVSKPIKIYWSRKNIYDWKLTSVLLPSELLD